MYLKQVYKHNKVWLVVMVVFIIGQLFINYKHGMVVSPFLHYGMYSGVMDIKNSYEIFEVYQNGKRLRGQDYSPEEWDKIMLPLQFHSAINKSNGLYQSDVKRLLSKMRISTKDANFLQSCNYPQFENWYKSYLQQITKEETASLSITYRTYAYQSNTLQPTNTFLPLSQLCR